MAYARIGAANNGRYSLPRMAFRPLRGKALVLVEPFDNKTDGGLVLPDIAETRPMGEKERPVFGKVLGLGAWKQTGNGYAILPPVKIGERVLLSKYLGKVMTHNVNDRLRLVDVDEILAVIEE